VIQERDRSEEIKDLHILYRTKREINGRRRKKICAYGSWKRIA
jgi:hypothetical protein